MKIEILEMLGYAVLGTLIFLVIAFPIVTAFEYFRLRRSEREEPQPNDDDVADYDITGARSAYERDEAWRRLNRQLKPKATSK